MHFLYIVTITTKHLSYAKSYSQFQQTYQQVFFQIITIKVWRFLSKTGISQHFLTSPWIKMDNHNLIIHYMHEYCILWQKMQEARRSPAFSIYKASPKMDFVA